MARPKVHMFTSTPGEMDTNSFLIETERSIVAVDTQFLATPARQVRAIIDAIGKPLVGVIISHSHPDHFNGTQILTEGFGDVPIMATQAVADGMRGCADRIREKWLPMYGSDYPAETIYPNRIVEGGHVLSVDGADIVIDSLGPGEAPDLCVVWVPGSGDMIAGDLIYDGVHAWVVEQRSQEWIDQLEDVKRRYVDARCFYSGHGGTGSTRLLDDQVAYIERFRDFVHEGARDGTIDQKQKSAIIVCIKQHFAGFKQDWWVPINVDAMANELGLLVLPE
ncbi:MBL fold metallo-hydrolase [Sphingomonas sp. C8-2]|jgi:glyoxylase-like metal-dependent hydrolase (beta-lactamase superfamily II)|uniref:Glyoxylase, beta-lactamase superfamily II n=1 Tax=Rhizorhabdus histidinilytica TaxID=439228 RepID=A0A1T5EJ46_9SPHN|nr:MBL fold metallo-hydrolase [Rhizorhabdus histidinilytica]QEH76781.1 MBL fold metallo-hydrolase [Sphingomonas sp. C8-2]SKB83937.1 Glyoxylase, beta-lactamase superfamily II [Rhizorhabdus histidinilytica]